MMCTRVYWQLPPLDGGLWTVLCGVWTALPLVLCACARGLHGSRPGVGRARAAAAPAPACGMRIGIGPARRGAPRRAERGGAASSDDPRPATYCILIPDTDARRERATSSLFSEHHKLGMMDL